MQRSNRWMIVVLIIAGLQLSACTQAPVKPSKSEPARIERIEKSDLKRVVLTEKAAERLGIQTAAVRDEQVVRKRTVGGRVVTLAGASAVTTAPPAGTVPGEATALSKVWVLVPLNESDVEKVDRGQPAVVLPLAGYDRATGLGYGQDNKRTSQAGGTGRKPQSDSKVVLTARSVEAPAVADPEEASEALYFAVDGTEHGLTPGQRVLVELSLSGSGSRTVVPYSAVIYDLRGETWTYTSPKPLDFVRHRVSVDYIDGDLAVLSEGLPAGTRVVTVGAAELFGAETGVGK